MQVLELDLDHEDFHCPVTGMHVLGEHGCAPSPATVFVYVQDENVFEFIREDLKPLANRMEGMQGGCDPADPDSPLELLKQALPGPNLVDFVLTTSGMACGPTGLTVHVGIDMNAETWTGAPTRP